MNTILYFTICLSTESLSPCQRERFCEALKNCFQKTSTQSVEKEQDKCLHRKENATGK